MVSSLQQSTSKLNQESDIQIQDILSTSNFSQSTPYHYQEN